MAIIAYSQAETMQKPEKRRYSRQTEHALRHFANLLSIARKERPLTIKKLAEKLNVSRTTAAKIMKGDPAVGIGLYFEAARILRLDLFEQEPSRLEMTRRNSSKYESLLPKKVRVKPVTIDNNF